MWDKTSNAYVQCGLWKIGLYKQHPSDRYQDFQLKKLILIMNNGDKTVFLRWTEWPHVKQSVRWEEKKTTTTNR